MGGRAAGALFRTRRGIFALLALLGAVVPAAAGGRTTCPRVLVMVHSCFAEADYPRSEPSAPASYDRLLGFFSWLSYYEGDSGFPVGDEWERSHTQRIGGNAQRWLLSWRALQPDGTRAPFLDLPLGAVRDSSPTTHAIAVSDRRYLGLLQDGMIPVLGIYGVPGWARAREAFGSHEVPDLRAWRAFVRAVALRYPRAVLEGFNEPNLRVVGDARRSVPAAAMAAMQATMYQTVKAVNPRQPVLGPGLTNGGKPGPWGLRDYLTSLYAEGLAGHLDGLALHPYPGGSVHDREDLGKPRNRFSTTLREAREVMGAAGARVPIYVTEIGVSTSGRPRVADEDAQSRVLMRIHRMLGAMPDVRSEIYFALRDRSSPDMRTWQFEYGLGWLHADGSPKAVFCAFAAAAGSSSVGC